MAGDHHLLGIACSGDTDHGYGGSLSYRHGSRDEADPETWLDAADARLEPAGLDRGLDVIPTRAEASSMTAGSDRRLDTGADRAAEGTGRGLSVCRVELLDPGLEHASVVGAARNSTVSPPLHSGGGGPRRVA